jgi:hypothetical protein
LGSAPEATLDTLQALFNTIFKQALTDTTLERRQKYAEAFTTRAMALLSECKRSLVLVGLFSTAFLLKSWLSAIRSSADIPPAAQAIPKLFYDVLLRDLKKITSKEPTDEGKSVLQRMVVYRALAENPYLSTHGVDSKAPLNANLPLRSLLYAVFETLQLPLDRAKANGSDKSLESSHPTDSLGSVATIDLLRAVATSGPTHWADVADLTSVLLRQQLPAHDYGMVLQVWDYYLQTLRPANKIQGFLTLMEQIERHKKVDGVEESARYQMLHIIIKTFTQEDLALSDKLYACLGKLCASFESATGIGQFGSCVASVNIILRTKQFLVSQHGIDTLLAALTTISSPTSAKLPKEHASFIHMHLCRTTNNILLLHRKRMGGRMHLLIPLLQNLLGALFVPHVRSTSTLPRWLHDNGGALKTENATAFSRILMTLSSPTVSSTQTRKHMSTSTSAPNLIDATKQARLYAGQYIPYILMHYCSLQLTGTLEGTMKEEVRKGVWSCMDVVDLEGMRALSEGIGRDERVMWAALFRDWERFGKGARSGRKV